ncbi:MAG: hypothetical protein IKM07_01345 [Clostridia bacterium]|nr:hypothetical protein [Oscillospiraceae bacterium]MBR6747555.1 hypothetical protein [Clostridia bacterium]
MNLPKSIYGGAWNTSHVQGIAIDTKREYMYYSFTTMLLKTDLAGNVIGSVTGLTGHLGDLDFNDEDGCVYGSLEYKAQESFYIAIFDVNKITRMDMDAEKDGIMTTVYLPEVVRDFVADMNGDGRFDGDKADTFDHRYGCSGIDGTAFGPAFGAPSDSPTQLMIAYGIYRNNQRCDNDYQIILQFDWRVFKTYAQPLTQSNPHRSGPDKPDAKYFIFTGNTTYGVQNLEYDAFTRRWFMAVYKGQKPDYPNFPLYMIDGREAPFTAPLLGQPIAEEALQLRLMPDGIADDSGIYGWNFRYGATGFIALDDGYYYLSHNGTTEDKKQTTTVYLYRWTGKAPDAFELVD